MMNEKHIALIKNNCEVRAEIFTPFHAIYYRDGGFGYVDTDVEDDGEFLEFSCNSIVEFHEICRTLEEDFF